MLKDYFFLALRNLRKRGIRSWLTMLGIFLGIAAVVSLISLGNALQFAITGQFGTLDPDKLAIQNTGTGFGPPGSTAPKKLTENDLELVESVPGVEFAIPRLIRQVKIDYNDISRFFTAGSMPPNREHLEIIYDVMNVGLESGKRIEASDRGVVILGNDFIANDYFEKDIRVGTNLEIQGKNFEVIGILERSGSFIWNSVILMPEDDLKDILDIGDEIDTIAVQVNDADRIEQTAQELERRLRRDRNQDPGEEDFSVQTPVQAISSINTILNIINLIVSGIAAVSLLVGGIGIANTMYTSVLERTKEIGVMKAVGARNRDVLFIFLIESALLGLAGGIIGAIIGLGLAFAASGAASAALGGLEFNVVISYPLLVASIGFSLLIGVISGILPAIQASRLHPVEALRK